MTSILRKAVFSIEGLIGIGSIAIFLFGLMAGLMDIKYFGMSIMFLFPAIPMITLGLVGFKELINKPLPRIVSFLIIILLVFSLWAVLPYPAVSGYQMSNFMVLLWGFFNIFAVALPFQLKIAIILFLFIHLFIIAFDTYLNSEIKPAVVVSLMKTLSILSLVIIVFSLIRPIIFKPKPTIKPDNLKNINLEVLDFVQENYYKKEYSASEWKYPSEKARKGCYEPLYFPKYKGYLEGIRLFFQDKKRKGAHLDVNIGIFDSDKTAIENFKYHLDYFHLIPRSTKIELGDECWFRREASWWWSELALRKNNVIITISYPEIADSVNEIPENLKILTNKLLSDITK
jgi:hypothetical protein